ncbi:MAG: tetratricopeptide repeat protein [Methylotenera sp.]
MKTKIKISVLVVAICFLLILAWFLLILTDSKDGSYESKLGKVFEFAVFVPAHNRIAEHYYIEAAKKNNFEAQCDLGMFYESQEDYQKSVYWYLQSSLNGWWKCEDDFEKYDFPDEQRAFGMLKIKADSGNKFAEYMVGKRYIEANGVATDVQTGIGYLKKAAINGSRGAQLYLAGLYLRGGVVSVDSQEAEKWMEMKWGNK